MPVDLFNTSNIGVQTSIYIFKAHTPHDFNSNVKFIDFRNDGYKRGSRGTQIIDDPVGRYEDIIEVWNNMDRAETTNEIPCVYDKITDSGADWNYEQHAVLDIEPTEEDFKKTVNEYLGFELNSIL